MTCERHKGPGTIEVMYVCSRGSRKHAPTCGYCRKYTATLLCDGRVPGRGKRTRTCSAALCEGCARNVGPDVDLCPACAARVDAAAAAPTPAPKPKPFEQLRLL